jgi:di- and tripeptidase
MQMLQRPDGDYWLVSGSGDADVKIWECQLEGGLKFLFSFDDLPGAVLSFAYRDSLLFGGLQDGQIKVWDLETRSCIRTIMAHDSDVMSMTIAGTNLYAAGANGTMFCFDSSFDCTATYQAHESAILSTVLVPAEGSRYGLISAGRTRIKIWMLPNAKVDLHPDRQDDRVVTSSNDGDVMLYGLAKLIEIPTVSDDEHREDCRQGAHLLKRLLTQMGAESRLLASIEGKNPLVMATFKGRDIGKPRKRVLFYGHYDVQPATETDWATNPFELSGRNGYLYGRGIADNKGPILAVACAAAALRERRMLDVDLVMIIEGEEEAGSAGFLQAMRRHKDDIGHVDTILLSNSSWVGEDDPCIVFGLRGVIYANLKISSKNADAHSGVDGGAVEEPMLAMLKLLSNLQAGDKVAVPGFYDDVTPMQEEEKEYYRAVAEISGMTVDTIVKKWREPTFSVANIHASGPANNTIIPQSVIANVSFRLVPNQVSCSDLTYQY